jgi:hypothetical protein
VAAIQISSADVFRSGFPALFKPAHKIQTVYVEYQAKNIKFGLCFQFCVKVIFTVLTNIKRKKLNAVNVFRF